MKLAKKECRKQQLVVLSSLTVENRHEQEAEVLAKLFAMSQWKHAQTIALTKAMAMEFPTDKIAALAWQQGKRVFVPVMREHHQLLFVEWTESTYFTQQAFGVEEPVEWQMSLPLRKVDLVVVPGLAFSKKGDRLGFGGGYYDRALEGLSVPTVSVTYEECVFEEARWPVELFDHRIDWVITSEGVWKNESMENESL